MSTAMVASAACVPRKLHALFAQQVHAVVFPKTLSSTGCMHLLAATRPARAVGESPELRTACRSLGLRLEGEFSESSSTGESLPALGTLTLPAEPPIRGVDIPKEKLAEQLATTRALLASEHADCGEYVIWASDADTQWVVDALTFPEATVASKEKLVETLLLGRATLLIDAEGVRELQKALETMDALSRRQLKRNVARLVVDAPVSSMTVEELKKFVGELRAVWGERTPQFRLRFPHTGSLALINASFTEISRRAPAVKLQVGAARELLVRGPGVVAGRRSEMRARRFVATGVAFRLKSQGEAVLFRGVPGERRRQAAREAAKPDLMRANWNTLKQVPVRLLRKRRGSKGQIYLTDKSQVSAFYRPRYFRSTGRKSRAVVRR